MARKRKRKLSPLQQEYRKQRRRVQEFVRRAKKRGYQFEEGIIPNIPKKITKASVERLKKLTPKKLYEKAEYVDIETGEIKTPKQRQLEVRKEATKKAKETVQRKKAKESVQLKKYIDPKNDKITGDIYIPTISIIDKIREYIENIPSSRAFATRKTGAFFEDFTSKKSSLLSILEDRYNDTEEYDLENEFIQKESEIAELIQVITYSSDSESVGYSFVKLAVLIKGSSLSHKEAEDISNEADYLNEME